MMTGDFGLRWKCSHISTVFFLHIVYELLFGLPFAGCALMAEQAAQEDEQSVFCSFAVQVKYQSSPAW